MTTYPYGEQPPEDVADLADWLRRMGRWPEQHNTWPTLHNGGLPDPSLEPLTLWGWSTRNDQSSNLPPDLIYLVGALAGLRGDLVAPLRGFSTQWDAVRALMPAYDLIRLSEVEIALQGMRQHLANIAIQIRREHPP